MLGWEILIGTIRSRLELEERVESTLREDRNRLRSELELGWERVEKYTLMLSCGFQCREQRTSFCLTKTGDP